MRLSVVIPIFNERQTLPSVLATIARALPEVDKEIILVDDGSNDGTREWLLATFQSDGCSCTRIEVDDNGRLKLDNQPGRAELTFKPFYHQGNEGKGSGIRTGLAAATGDIIVIQDADLEYDPADWETMYNLVAVRKVADVVYGSRFFGRPHRSLYFHHYLANRMISVAFNLLYNQTLSDIEVCYKMFTRAVKECLHITCRDFGCEIQISAQICRSRKWRIYEVGIQYFGRTYAEGKKVNWKDGIKAFWYILKFRIV